MKEYIKDNMKLYNGDCMEGMDQYPDNYFDLAIVDPPYGIGMDNSNKRTKPSRPNSYTQYKDLRYHKAEWDNEPPKETYFKEIERVSKNRIIWGANYFPTMLSNGFGWIYWNKLNGENNCFSDGEFAFSSKGIQSRHVQMSQFDGTNGGKDRIHPTQKPVKLYSWLLQNYSSPEHKILDTHLGSASHAIAWHYFQKGGEFVGYELDSEYFDKSIARIEQETAQISMF